MAQVSVGRVENLEELVSGLLSVRETLESACREQSAAAEGKCTEAGEEAQNSNDMLERAIQQVQVAHQKLAAAREALESAKAAQYAAEGALSSCMAQPCDEDGAYPDCSMEEQAVSQAETAVEHAQAALAQAQACLEQAAENQRAMELRTGLANQALALAQETLEAVRQECCARLASVSHAVDAGEARLTAARQALSAYLATNPEAEQFHSWLRWKPDPHSGPVTPDMLRDRMNLSAGQRALLQEYLYERNPSWRRLVDRYRTEWRAAKGDAERNMVTRKTRIHLSGEFAEQMAKHALAPLGGSVETQGRTIVGDNGRYTKTDLLVTDVRVPVILGRGEGMGVAVGGSMAFEVKCGKADYLYAQKDHMVFQARGHDGADAHCTYCSRDIHDLPPEKEKELRDAMREAGSPLVGGLPSKSEIDRSCLEFIHQGEEGQQ